MPLVALILLESILLWSGFRASGLVRQLRGNAEQMLAQQVEIHRDNLHSIMTNYWSDLRSTADSINETAQTMLEDGTLDIQNMQTTGGARLLAEIIPELVPQVHAKRVSGIFVILNSDPLPEKEALATFSDHFLGVCLRDMDPNAPYVDAHTDLLLERAPTSVVTASGISTTQNWMPVYEFQTDDCIQLLYPAFQAAYLSDGRLTDTDCSYWTRPYTLAGSSMTCIAYTMPLILDDGTVYGVLGVEVEDKYLYNSIPSGELSDQGAGAYVLVVEETAGQADVVLTPDSTIMAEGSLDLLARADGHRYFKIGDTEYATATKQLDFYGSNTPFVSQHWALMGVVERDILYSFAENIAYIIVLLLLILLFAGFLGSLFTSQLIARPILRLSQRVDEAQKAQEGFPDLPRTHIREIDRFSDAIVSLNQSVIESSTRFLSIMNMASIELGGFEILGDSDEVVFIAENFFPMLELDVDISQPLSTEQFFKLISTLEVMPNMSYSGDTQVYRISAPNGVRYVRIQITQYGDHIVGLAEDVTTATMERMRIEHERDYDVLTGLYNRRAVYRMVGELFSKPEELRCAALVMLDLDGLKSINDNYGHDLGDQYIRQASRCFLNTLPQSTLCARLAGDEFYLFFYGYASQNLIRAEVDKLNHAIQNTTILLPDGESRNMSASMGIAWYPQNATDADTLMRYADFAMYQVKHVQRGRFGEFDLQAYEIENNSARCLQEFKQMLEHSLVQYHFQPLFNARTGAVSAYEALMRVDLPTLKNPEQVNNIAASERRLGDLERLTMFKGTESFMTLREQGKLEKNAYLFLNSLASQHLNEADRIEYREKFAPVLDRLVLEIVEVDHLDPEALRFKWELTTSFALDDYGSGYNSEKTLLELSPRFIKVDLSIIRDIDSNLSKQHIVSNIVSYAHQRDMLIVAEGIETAAELITVIDLGVDLLQGYYLARPAAIPGPISNEALSHILARSQNC